jgi:hypothetical protein
VLLTKSGQTASCNIIIMKQKFKILKYIANNKKTKKNFIIICNNRCSKSNNNIKYNININLKIKKEERKKNANFQLPFCKIVNFFFLSLSCCAVVLYFKN